MRAHQLLLGLAVTATTLLSASSAFADPCPEPFSHERDSVFHKSPKKRLTKNLVSKGRVCLNLKKPQAEGGKLKCPSLYGLEYVGIFQDAFKRRKIHSLQTAKKGGKRHTCLRVMRPRVQVYGCDAGFHHERPTIMHDGPKVRLVTRYNNVSDGRTCLRFTRPSVHNGKANCPAGLRHEGARIFHDAPKKRLLNHGNTVTVRGERTTCIHVMKPRERTGGRA